MQVPNMVMQLIRTFSMVPIQKKYISGIRALTFFLVFAKSSAAVFGQRCGVDGPGQVLADVYTQELGAVTRFTAALLMVKMLSVLSPEVHYNLLCLLCIQVEIVVIAPHGQAVQQSEEKGISAHILGGGGGSLFNVMVLEVNCLWSSDQKV